MEYRNYYWYLRGTRDRALMLELRKTIGEIRARGYAWLEYVDFKPSEGILLRFGGQEIRITGRNLNLEIRPNVRLFQSITRHRVPWIQEADHAASLESGPKTVLVERIEC